MAKRSLTEAIGEALSNRADALKNELRAIGEDYKEVGRIAVYGRKKKKKAKRRSAAKSARRRASGGGARKATARKATARKARPKTKIARHRKR